MVPVNKLLFRKIFLRAVINPIEVGIVLVNKLVCKYNSRNFTIDPIVRGIEPTILFKDKSSVNRFVNNLIVLGTPLSKFLVKDRYANLVTDPIVLGNVPVILLAIKYREFKFVSNPIVLGMVDVRRILTNTS